MKRPELYKKSVDILYNAYFNDTLEHGNCYACAVGNLIAANFGYSIGKHCDSWVSRSGMEYIPYWTHVHCVSKPSMKAYTGEAKNQIDITGYSPFETARIEFAFEDAERGKTKDDRMFNGLVAVLKVLDEIHQVEQDTAAQSKERFATHYATLQS